MKKAILVHDGIDDYSGDCNGSEMAMVMPTTLTNASTRLASRATPLKLGKAT